VTGPDGGLVTGGFINFDEHRNPVVFVEELFFNPVTQQPFLVSTSPVQIGIASIQPGLVVEFVKAETPRAIKAYGRLTPHNAGNDLAYDKEFVRKAVQFVIDNVTGKDKLLLHGPIDVDVVRRGGIVWGPRKPNCYAQDFHVPKHRSATKSPTHTTK
jgi:hypothetical protein